MAEAAAGLNTSVDDVSRLNATPFVDRIRDTSRISNAGLFAALVVVGLVPRLVLVALNAASIQPWEYDTLARNIVAGQGYVIPRFDHVDVAFGDGNLYSFLSAVVYLVVGYQPVVLAVVQAVLASLAAPVIFVIGRRAFGARVAILGALLAILHPGLLAYSTKLHPLGLDVLLLALSVLWISRIGDRPRTGLMAGLGLGLTLMSRPTFFLSGLAVLASRWFLARRRLAPMLMPVVLAVVIAAPWVIRDWAVLRRPVFISSGLEDVWKGNNPLASGSSYLPTGKDVLASAPAALQTRLHQADELQRNDVFAGAIVDFVSQQPRDFAALTARKFSYFWWLSPQAGLLYPSSWLGWYQIYFVIAMAFAVVAAIAVVRHGTSEEHALLSTLLVISLTLALIHALSYVEGRHRWGVEPLLLLFTARGIVAALAALRASVRTFAAYV